MSSALWSFPEKEPEGEGLLHLGRLPDVPSALWDAGVAFRDEVALIECDRDRELRRLTYGEVLAEVRRFGGCLQATGLGPNDRVAILMGNQSRWLTSAFAVLASGATLVPIDAKLEPEEIEALLAHCGARALITESSHWRRLQGRALPKLVWVVRREGAGGEGALKALSGARSWEETPARSLVTVVGRPESLACIVYSSGTGGTPKGCMLTHGNYLAQAEILGNLFPMAVGDRYFSILPTNHAIDFMCGFIVPFLFGAAVVHQLTLRPQTLTGTLKRYRITHMGAVPMVLRAMREKIEESLEAQDSAKRWLLEGLFDLNDALTHRKPRPEVSRRLLKPVHDELGGRLRLVVCGGARVDRRDAEFFYRLGIPVAIGYGLTEACTVVSVNRLRPFRGDTVGPVVPRVEVRIHDADEGGVGEVWVRGPTVMQGYWNAPELTRETIVDGWLRTGDLGRIDAARHLHLTGRRKNMIVTSGGKNVYPEDVEHAFGDIPGVEELCVMAADYLWPAQPPSESLVVVVRPKRESSEQAALRQAFIEKNRRLAPHKRVAAVVWWSSPFPRTASMKVKRDRLADALRGEVSRESCDVISHPAST